MVQCAACGKFMNAKEGVTCPKCKSKSHHECVRVPDGVTVSSTWRCGECQLKTPKARDLSTPIRGVQDSYLPSPRNEDTAVASGPSSSGTHKMNNLDMVRALRDEMRAEFGHLNEVMSREFKNSKDKLGSFFVEMAELKQELAATRSLFNERFGTYDSRLEALELSQKQDATALKQEVNTLQQALEEVKEQLNDREQEFLLNDVVISGIHEHKGENTMHFVTLLGTKLGLTLDDRDIVMSEREGAQRPVPRDSSSLPRSRRIVVRFARRANRDAFLQAARVRRGLTSSDLGTDGAAAHIYVNERLTRKNGQLFARAREECRTRNWKYCWSKDGRIFVRKEHGSSYARIRFQKDLDRIFGIASA